MICLVELGIKVMKDIRKKIIRGVAVLVVAGGAGHYVQKTAAQRAAPQTTAQTLAAQPQNIETVAASDQPLTSAPAPAAVTRAPEFKLPPLASLPANPPVILPTAPVTAPVTAPATETLAAAPTPAAPTPAECTPTLDLLSDDNAMIGVTLIAPCHGDQPFTLRHAGLVIAQSTSTTGSFFAFVPALSRDGAISVTFKDGQELTGAVEVPALDGLRRVALIWQAPDAFGIQALEDDATYGAATAISAENPQTPVPGAVQTSGYLTRIGDPAAPAALMADVYTYPAGGGSGPQVLFEAAVTPDSCGREIYAELVNTVQGQATSKELVLTLPDCDGENGFLVLNNPFQDQSIAALN